MLPRLLPLFLVGFAPVALPAMLLAPSAAHAQAVSMAQPVIDLVPAGDVLGDGKTATRLYVVAVGKNGQPVTELSGKVTAAEGETGRFETVAPGLFAFDWTPPAVDSARTVEVTVRGKVEGHGNVTSRVPVRVVPSTRHSVSITSNPANVVLGQDASATITLQLTGGAAETIDGADLVVRASSGTVANVTPLGRGQYSLLYTPPGKLFPHLALLTVADRRDPSGTAGAIAVPLQGKAPFPVTGLPGSSIIVRVAGKEFGPVQADAQGKANVPLVVPPGVTQATVISVLGEQRQEAPLDLKVPATQRVQIVPTAAAVVADGSTSTTLRVFVAQPDGTPDPAATLSFSSSAGAIGAARHEGGGVYAAEWTPAAQTRATTAQVGVTLADPKGDQKDNLEVRLLPARPGSLTLSTDPADLSSSPAQVEAQARVEGGAAGGVRFTAAGLSASGSVQDRGAGSWAQSFSVGSTQQATVQAAVVADASGNPLHRLLVFPAIDQVAADGASQVGVTVMSVDAQGYPVGNVPVALSVSRGDGQLSAGLTTDANGLAHATLRAGKAAGIVEIQAASGDHVGAAGVLQLPAGSASFDLPAVSAAAQRWDALVRGQNLSTSGASAVAVAMPTTAPAPSGLAGPIARLELSPSAASVTPGGTIDIAVSAVDEQGRKASGRQLQVFANAGTVSALESLGNGAYTTRLVAPASGTSVIRVTILSPDSGVSGMIEVPVQESQTWVAASEPAATSANETPVMPVTNPPATTETTATVKPPKAETDRPWLRIRAGFLGGFYSYEQVPASATGALYGDRIAFGGGDTPAAGAAGLGASARAWSPGSDYFGAAVEFRASRYAVELADFDGQVIGDWVTDTQVLLLARYPVDLDRTRLHVGARAGVGIGDFMIYRQQTENGAPVLEYGPLVVPSANLGAEVGIDHDGSVFFTGGGTFGFNGGSGLYSTAFDAEVGWAFMDNVYVYGNVGYTGRKTPVFEAETDASVGDLDDDLLMFGAGVGWQL